MKAEDKKAVIDLFKAFRDANPQVGNQTAYSFTNFEGKGETKYLTTNEIIAEMEKDQSHYADAILNNLEEITKQWPEGTTPAEVVRISFGMIDPRFAPRPPQP